MRPAMALMLYKGDVQNAPVQSCSALHFIKVLKRKESWGTLEKP